MNEVWCVELNLDAKDYQDPLSWHLDVLEKSVVSNLKNFMHGRKFDRWTILAIADTHEEARNIAVTIRKELKNKEEK